MSVAIPLKPRVISSLPNWQLLTFSMPLGRQWLESGVQNPALEGFSVALAKADGGPTYLHVWMSLTSVSCSNTALIDLFIVKEIKRQKRETSFSLNI